MSPKSEAFISPGEPNSRKRPWYFLALLIFAGESVFILPFVLSRVFRPTVLEVFELDNLQLGICFSVYGVVAMLSYLLGGPIADRFSPGKLISVALWTTALGGLIYATFPGLNVLKVLYGYWGFTTIFLFWSPMIKATRIWGGTTKQGKAFGFLDGGRGLVGALFGTLGVLIFSYSIGGESGRAVADSREAFRMVILASSGIVAFVGILTWFFLKLDDQTEKSVRVERITPAQVREVLRIRSVWLLMIIILCAYVGYKVTDVFSLYAQEVMHYTEVGAAGTGTFLLYVRPLVGVLIGLAADRGRITLWLFAGFVIAFAGALLLASGVVIASQTVLFFLSVLIVASGVYAARCLYFAVMERGRIPVILTGTAVGVISLTGYTPDVFAGPLTGYLLDRSPGIQGHQHVFLLLAFFSLAGGLAAWYYFRIYGKRRQKPVVESGKSNTG